MVSHTQAVYDSRLSKAKNPQDLGKPGPTEAWMVSKGTSSKMAELFKLEMYTYT